MKLLLKAGHAGANAAEHFGVKLWGRKKTADVAALDAFGEKRGQAKGDGPAAIEHRDMLVTRQGNATLEFGEDGDGHW
jgi:hypothetical protein